MPHPERPPGALRIACWNWIGCMGWMGGVVLLGAAAASPAASAQSVAQAPDVKMTAPTAAAQAAARVAAYAPNGEDGYRLWLRYEPVAGTLRGAYQSRARSLVIFGHSSTLQAARHELQVGLTGMLGAAPPVAEGSDAAASDPVAGAASGRAGGAALRAGGIAAGSIVLGTPARSHEIAARASRLGLAAAGAEGYVIRSTQWNGRPVMLIAANSDVGLLYGSFRLLALMQMHQPLADLDLHDAPRLKLRVLDHWDNPDRSVERGYAGQSIWDFWKLPGYIDPRYTDYARADASVGINGVVINNVNANTIFLTDAWIAKEAAIADALRPYGIRLYLSVNFAAPVQLRATTTADPLDPAVVRWWHDKVEQIYGAIPDFGGFLVKADSEGQPGPQTYHRSHAQGANMFAAVLALHGGVVMWRAFVYASPPGSQMGSRPGSQAERRAASQPGAEPGSQARSRSASQPRSQPGPQERSQAASQPGPSSAPQLSADRVKQAYEEFKPLDGQFAANVLLQIKNGPLDFQPREPFHPLFGALPHTHEMLEVPVTKEYLGMDTHLVYMGAYYAETLAADTYARGKGTTVAKVLEGVQAEPAAQAGRTAQGGPIAQAAHTLTGMAGVANIGSDRDWTGSIFNQANWYAFGRLAWNPEGDPRLIARQWLQLTFSNDARVIGPLVEMMMRSRQAVVDYMTPLGLAHQMGTGHHYGPAPWVADLKRPEWNPAYYNHAGADGIGFERTATGSNAVAQYAPEVARRFAALDTVGDDYLLWFHHVPWSYRLSSGRTVWAELVARYSRGVQEVADMRRTWESLRWAIDPRRFYETDALLKIQQSDAQLWRDACIAYFQSQSGLPLPPGFKPPAHPLQWYESQVYHDVPGNGPEH